MNPIAIVGSAVGTSLRSSAGLSTVAMWGKWHQAIRFMNNRHLRWFHTDYDKVIRKMFSLMCHI